MECGNRLQILIETRLGSGGILLGAGELRDGQVGQPILQIAEVLARRGGGADNGDQPRLFGKSLRVAHQFSYQQRGRHVAPARVRRSGASNFMPCLSPTNKGRSAGSTLK